MRRLLLLVTVLLVPLGAWAGPRLVPPLGSAPTVVWGTYQEDSVGNQLPFSVEVYTRFAREVLTVQGVRGSQGLAFLYVGPDGRVVRSTVDRENRPRLVYVNGGQRGWGVLIVQDSHGRIVHQDVELAVSRRLGPGVARRLGADPRGTE